MLCKTGMGYFNSAKGVMTKEISGDKVFKGFSDMDGFKLINEIGGIQGVQGTS
jgi:hypothetical protein